MQGLVYEGKQSDLYFWSPNIGNSTENELERWIFGSEVMGYKVNVI